MKKNNKINKKKSCNVLAEVLLALRGKPVSGSVLAQKMKVTRAGVHKQIQKLRSRGYGISGTNRLGYSLKSAPEFINGTKWSSSLGGPLCCHPALTSTQDEAKRQAFNKAPEGTVVIADQQTNGRGRMGRKWESPKGGLWYSLILRPALKPRQIPGLVLAAALDWVCVIREKTGLLAQVKWPNDVWIGKRKCAGILAEMSSELDRVDWVVLGVGVNVNARPSGRMKVPAVSLSEITKEPLSRQMLLKDWLVRFSESYQRYLQHGFSAFQKVFQEYSVLKGHKIEFEGTQGRCVGMAQGVDSEGRLEVYTTRENVLVSGGEVFVSI